MCGGIQQPTTERATERAVEVRVGAGLTSPGPFPFWQEAGSCTARTPGCRQLLQHFRLLCVKYPACTASCGYSIQPLSLFRAERGLHYLPLQPCRPSLYLNSGWFGIVRSTEHFHHALRGTVLQPRPTSREHHEPGTIVMQDIRTLILHSSGVPQPIQTDGEPPVRALRTYSVNHAQLQYAYTVTATHNRCGLTITTILT